MNEDTKQFLDALERAAINGYNILEWHGKIPEQILEWKKARASQLRQCMNISIETKPIYSVRKRELPQKELNNE